GPRDGRMAAPVLRQHRTAVVHSVEFSLFPLTTSSSILCILTDRQPDALAFLPPFQVVGSFPIPLGLAVYEHNVGPDTPIGGQNNRAIPHTFCGLDAFSKVDFAGLDVGHSGATSDSTRYLVRYHQYTTS